MSDRHQPVARPLVNPGGSPAAQRLLTSLYQLSGRRTMSGQHNTPRELSYYSDQAQRLTGHAPAIWGQDFGFAECGDMDGVNFRPAIVAEAKRQHAAGSIITLMWHAVRPTEEEPVTFGGSVCRGPLDQTDWDDLLTPGTRTHTRWLAQIDVIAELLGQLQQADVPVIWRPYHELNGDWFWWCGRPGPHGYAALYRMMYDRYVNYHRLDNLIWVWNASTPNDRILPYTDCYPGHDVVDVLAVDIYGNEFEQRHYDGLVELAAGRPIALGEVGVMPSRQVLEAQPLWSWFMTWTNFLTRENDREAVRNLYNDPRILNRPAVPRSCDPESGQQ